MEICLPFKFIKESNEALQMDTQMMTVNNLFGHWFTDIDISHYPDDMGIFLTANSVDIYQYSIAPIKYLPEKSVKKLLKTMFILISKFTKPKMLIEDPIMENYIFQKYVCRIPLSLIVDLGLVNFSLKTNTKIILTLEINMNKLVVPNKKVTAVTDNPDALIQFFDRSYISYQKINLTKGADLSFTSILRFKTALMRCILPSPYQQIFEVNTGQQSLTCIFKGAINLLFIINYINTRLFMIVII